MLVSKSRSDQRELRLRISARGRRLVDLLGQDIEKAYADIRDLMEPAHMSALYRELTRFIDRVGPDFAG